VLADYQDRGQTAKDAGVKSEWPVGIGDGWMRLMTFDMAGEVPAIKVRTYSTHYKKLSVDTPEYAAWYKEHEQPQRSDKDYHGMDDFSIQLTDFHKRFSPAKASKK
jgi:hypothetical protein